MARSYYKQLPFENNRYILNYIRQKKMKGGRLLVSANGAWFFLTDEEYKSLIRYEINDNLYKLLEDTGIIITPRNTKRIIEDQRKRLSFIEKGVSLHILVPTLRCNQRCVYCHSSVVPTTEKDCDMSKETADKILDFIFQSESNDLTIEFQGGDGLLSFDLIKYITIESRKRGILHKKKTDLVIVTNLTLLDDEKLNWLASNKVHVCTSLDGPKEVHDFNRQFINGNGTYDILHEKLKLLKQKKANISALMVTTKKSLGFYKEIIDEYVKLGIKNIQLKYLNKLGFASKEWDEIGYSVEEFKEFWIKGMDYILELNNKGIYIEERFAKLILIKVLTNQDPGFLDFRNPCGLATGQLAYNYNGDIYACDEGRNFELFKLGNVNTQTQKDLFKDKNTQSLITSSINDLYLCDNCAYKPFCGLCPALSYSEDGNILSKLPINSICKIRMFQFDYIFDKLLNDEKARKTFASWVKSKG